MGLRHVCAVLWLLRLSLLLLMLMLLRLLVRMRRLMMLLLLMLLMVRLRRMLLMLLMMMHHTRMAIHAVVVLRSTRPLRPWRCAVARRRACSPSVSARRSRLSQRRRCRNLLLRRRPLRLLLRVGQVWGIGRRRGAGWGSLACTRRHTTGRCSPPVRWGAIIAGSIVASVVSLFVIVLRPRADG